MAFPFLSCVTLGKSPDLPVIHRDASKNYAEDNKLKKYMSFVKYNRF